MGRRAVGQMISTSSAAHAPSSLPACCTLQADSRLPPAGSMRSPGIQGCLRIWEFIVPSRHQRVAAVEQGVERAPAFAVQVGIHAAVPQHNHVPAGRRGSTGAGQGRGQLCQASCPKQKHPTAGAVCSSLASRTRCLRCPEAAPSPKRSPLPLPPRHARARAPEEVCALKPPAQALVGFQVFGELAAHKGQAFLQRGRRKAGSQEGKATGVSKGGRAGRQASGGARQRGQQRGMQASCRLQTVLQP